MGIKILAPPPLLPLSRISPSKYYALRECSLREIWSASQQPPLLPTYPSAHLGIIVHKMLELAFSGNLIDENDMRACWEKEVQRQEQKMKENPLEAHLIPLAACASNYYVKQIMTYNIIRPLLRELAFRTVKAKKSETEEWVQAKNGKVGGRIDLVRHTDDGISIIDYKTGMIIDSNQSGVPIREEYQNQLKMYASLYFLHHSLWPSRLILVGLNQQEYQIPLDKKECMSLIENAEEFFEETNKSISAGLDADAFAFPKPATCRFCNYRPACRSYWEKRDNNHAWPSDFQGAVTNKKILGNSLLKLEVENQGIKIVIRGLASARHPILHQNIKEIMLCNMGKDTLSSYYREIPMTTGYALS